MRSFIPLALLFIGEAVYIWVEMLIAHTAKTPQAPSFLTIIRVVSIATLAGLAILAGYYFGYKDSKNIWLVTATSIGAILITEPIVSWITFHELPTNGALIGLVFGFLGLLSTLFL